MATDNDLTLRSLFQGTLERFGTRPAVRAGDRELTYRDIARAANRLAHVLVGHGVTPGSPVALMMPNRLEWVVADQAIIRAGAAKVPVNSMLSAPEVAYNLRDSGAAVALADDSMSGLAREAGVATVLALGPDWDAALAAGRRAARKASSTGNRGSRSTSSRISSRPGSSTMNACCSARRFRIRPASCSRQACSKVRSRSSSPASTRTPSSAGSTATG